ncbi:hypothetical protein AVEN_130130-1 [Araneus ventricosus]|uniref:Uncharacterized protein n=1 Tax=Araneus ventricosus TaxID=182803 RepID=A0A4Y2EHY1_ARAVE|nr:hypothetical protein AVEN_74510-1 [Araneus ventricosus]GBM27704.1 hypothetical protein AVEN_130130-1 [Araneus ventricosus]
MRHERKRTSETVPLGKAKSAPDSGSADSPIQCRSKRKCLGTHSSTDTVGYGTVQQTSHSCAFVDQESSSTTSTVGPENIETGPWMSGRKFAFRMNPDFSFIMSMVVSRYAVCQANSCSPLVQKVIHRLVVAVLCFGGRSHGWFCDP